MKKIDLKPLLIEKGERVGLYVAAGLTIVLLIMGVLKGFGSSATANAEKISKRLKELGDAQLAAQPTEKHRPRDDGSSAITQVGTYDAVPASGYTSNQLYYSAPPIDSKRQPPGIFGPDEFAVSVLQQKLPSLVFDYETRPDGRRVPIMVTLVETTQAATTGPAGFGGAMGAMGAMGAPGGMGGFPGMTGPAGGLENLNRFMQGRALGARGAMGAMGAKGLPGRKPKGYKPRVGEGNKTISVTLKEADARKPGQYFAVQPRPARIGVIAASFPYKKQVEEFRNKLRLATHGEVLTESVRGDKKETWNSFQFRGLIVERMTVAPLEGNKKPEWEAVPMDEAYYDLLIDLARQTEPDDKSLDTLKKVSRGLVRALPKVYTSPNTKAKPYPDLFGQLKNVNATLAKLNDEQAKKSVITQSNLIKEININDLEGETQQKQPGPPGMGDPPMPPMPPMPPPGGIDEKHPYRIPGQTGEEKIKETPIDHCLLRFVDVTLESGKAYQYRIKVRMSNPNYSPKPEDRLDTYPQFAKEKELESDWVIVHDSSGKPLTLVVPPDSMVYAADHRVLEPRLRNVRVHDEKTEVVVQIQRWVESYRPNPKIDDERPVGEWVVADRIIVKRGEYVSHMHKTPIPIKNINAFEFELDEKSFLPFGYDLSKDQEPVASVLVDFEGGKMRYERVMGPVKEGETPQSTSIVDQTANELLIMSPDGRVYVRNEATDSSDLKRKQRYEDYLQRVKSIKDKGKPTPPPTGKP